MNFTEQFKERVRHINRAPVGVRPAEVPHDEPLYNIDKVHLPIYNGGRKTVLIGLTYGEAKMLVKTFKEKILSDGTLVFHEMHRQFGEDIYSNPQTVCVTDENLPSNLMKRVSRMIRGA